MFVAGEEDERRELEEYQKGEDEREKKRRKENGGDVIRKKKKIYVYTNKELEIKERFIKLYEKFAPEKVRRMGQDNRYLFPNPHPDYLYDNSNPLMLVAAPQGGQDHEQVQGKPV